jgi:hypothetical protein
VDTTDPKEVAYNVMERIKRDHPEFTPDQVSQAAKIVDLLIDLAVSVSAENSLSTNKGRAVSSCIRTLLRIASI